MKKTYTPPKATLLPVLAEQIIAESGNSLSVVNEANDGVVGDAREENNLFDDCDW